MRIQEEIKGEARGKSLEEKNFFKKAKGENNISKKRQRREEKSVFHGSRRKGREDCVSSIWRRGTRVT